MPTHRFVQVLQKTSHARLDPCCGGYRSAAKPTTMAQTTIESLNPCCGGYRSATGTPYSGWSVWLVSILVVVDIGLRLSSVRCKVRTGSVSILVVVDIGLRLH